MYASIKPPAPKIISETEFEIILEAVKEAVKPWMVYYWQNLLLCASDAGLRLNEAVRLRVNDLETKETKPILIIRKQKNGFGNEYTVPSNFLSYRLKKHIEFYREQIREKEGYLFFGFQKRSKYVTGDTVKNFIEKLRKITGINDAYGYRKSRFKDKEKEALHRFSYHTLRHLYCVRLSAGASPQPPQNIQAMMRHRSLNSTLRYLHYNVQLKQKIVEDVFNNPPQQITAQDTSILADRLRIMAEEIKDLKKTMHKETIY